MPAAAVERSEHRVVQRRHGDLAWLGQQQRRGLRGRQHHPAVSAATAPAPDQTTSPAAVSSSSIAGE